MKRIQRFIVKGGLRNPFGGDDLIMTLYLPLEQGNKRAGRIHLEGLDYPNELKRAKNLYVSIEYSLPEDEPKHA